MILETAEEVSTAIVAEMPETAIQALLSLAGGEPIVIVRPPRAGLTLMSVRDAFDHLFYLGEVLVTDAEVALGERRGCGIVPGDAPARALARACAEVLLAGENDLLRSRVRQLLAAEEECLRQRRRGEEELIARTRVSFDLMAGS